MASGKDALNDAIISLATLAAAIVYIRTGYSVEAWVSAAISLFIMKTGFDTLRETAGSIIGKRMDAQLIQKVRETIRSFPEVEDAYDIVIHSYGKENLLGSAYVEVLDRYKVAWVDNLQRAVARKVLEETGVKMLGLSIYAINTRSEETVRIREAVRRIVSDTQGARQMHGFYIDLVDKTMNFEVAVEFGKHDNEALREELIRKMKTAYPEYQIRISVENEY